MHLDIPFYPNFATQEHPEGVHCLEMSLKMVLAFFQPEKDYSIEDLETITHKKPGKGSWEIPYSVWFTNNGFEVINYSEFDYQAFKDKGIEYIREEYGQEVADWQKENTDYKGALDKLDEFIEKVKNVKKKPTIHDITAAMQDGYIARVSVNSGLLNDTDEYLGHSVIVTGFNDQSIWFHDPGLPPLENRKTSQSKFQKAMDEFGGEMQAIRMIVE